MKSPSRSSPAGAAALWARLRRIVMAEDNAANRERVVGGGTDGVSKPIDSDTMFREIERVMARSVSWDI